MDILKSIFMRYVKLFLILTCASAALAFGLYLTTSSEQAQEAFLPSGSVEDDLADVVRTAPSEQDVSVVPDRVVDEGDVSTVADFEGDPGTFIEDNLEEGSESDVVLE